MSRLDELIKELCPNGVVYMNFFSVAQYIRGVTYNKNQEVTDGRDGYKLLRANNITLSSNTLNFEDVKTIDKTVKVKSSQFLMRGDILICAGSGSKEHIGKVAYVFDDYEYTFGGFMGVIRTDTALLLSRYLFHILTGSIFKLHLVKAAGASSSTINNINNDTWKDFLIPVPPIEVQREIARILDNFTLLTSELTSELTARQKQYEYYRDQLLTFVDNGGETTRSDIKWMPLGELFPFIRNGFVGTIKPFFTTADKGIRYLEGTNIHDGIISDNEMLYVTKEFHQKHIKNELMPDDILMVQSGHIGECAVVGDKYKGANCHALIIMSNGGQCLSKYVVHYFHTEQGKKALAPAITGGTIQHVLAGKMDRIQIPVPTLIEQKRIVDILDRFEQVTKDVASGLPAEITARQKQYEYYRDKLLTFKKHI